MKCKNKELQSVGWVVVTCDEDSEPGSVNAVSYMLLRGRWPKHTGARLAGDERQDTHLVIG